MNLYLVRHGMTFDNKAKKAAPPTSSLHELGVNQAISVGNRLKNISFDSIFVSDAVRAVQTAQHIIVHHSHMKVTTTRLLREHKKPTEMHGLLHTSDKAQKMYAAIESHMEERDWHFSDEENYYDFAGRLLEFLKLVEARDDKNILVVTHSLVIRLLMCLVVFGKDMTATEFHRARWNLKIANTGVTIFRRNTHTSTSGWELVTFNDIAHLAE